MVLAHNIEEGNRTQDVQISQNVTFDSMLLKPHTLQGLRNSGFYRPSPIQLHGIPLGKCGFDLLLEAKSGTGKTAVFSVIALEQIELLKGLQVIILAPTREIASQICDVIKQIGSFYEGLKVEVVMGGLPVQEDISKLKNNDVHIVVGSPGRLRHLIHDKHVNTSAVRLLILDEADKLMEKSFLKDLNFIFCILPKQKQVIMSSATFPETTKSFIEQYVLAAQHVCPDSNSILLGIKQEVTVVKQNSNIVTQTKYRFEELLKILSSNPFKQCLIFCNYQARVAELHKMLTEQKWPAEQLYGQQEQRDRLDALKSLQEYKCRILIATDLAARGIDASNVDLVINFEPPFEWQTYLHRIGRAGRFGSYGIAKTILCEGKEEDNFTKILQTIKFPINLTKSTKTRELNTENQIAKTRVSDTIAVKSNASDNYEKLWHELNNFREAKADEMESFNDLCKAFEKETIVPFEDLITSFEDHKHINRNSNYHHQPMQCVSVAKYIKTIHEKTKNIKDELMNQNIIQKNHHEVKIKLEQDRMANIKKSQSNNKLYQEHFLNTDGKQLIHKKVILNKDDEYKIPIIEEAILSDGLKTPYGCTKVPDAKKTTDTNNGHHWSNIDGHKYKKRLQNKTLDDEYEIPNIDKALLSAGLPTAFGSTKKNYNTDNSVHYTRNHIIKKEPTEVEYALKSKPTRPSKLNDLPLDMKSNCDKKTVLNNHRITRSSENVHNEIKTTNGIKSKTNRNLLVHEKEGVFQYNPQQQKQNRQSAKKDLEVPRNQSHNEAYQDYINWYNQLKFTVKQVEYAIYVEEMSKI